MSFQAAPWQTVLFLSSAIESKRVSSIASTQQTLEVDCFSASVCFFFPFPFNIVDNLPATAAESKEYDLLLRCYGDSTRFRILPLNDRTLIFIMSKPCLLFFPLCHETCMSYNRSSVLPCVNKLKRPGESVVVLRSPLLSFVSLHGTAAHSQSQKLYCW